MQKRRRSAGIQMKRPFAANYSRNAAPNGHAAAVSAAKSDELDNSSERAAQRCAPAENQRRKQPLCLRGGRQCGDCHLGNQEPRKSVRIRIADCVYA